VRKVFGDTAFLQRCTLHKRRNVRDHLPKDQQAWVDRKLAAGVGSRLAMSLTNTKCIESMISIARDRTRDVRWWRDGKMIKRWCAAGMLNAERSVRRLEGYLQMPTFVAALARHVEAVPPACDAARVA
jgi:putative transposase